MTTTNDTKAYKHALYLYGSTIRDLAHIRQQTGMSTSRIIRHLVTLYASGMPIPPLPKISGSADAMKRAHDLAKLGLGEG
jgi:hypothetical protein